MKKKLFVAAALLAAMGASGKGRDAAPKRIADSDGIVRIEVLACEDTILRRGSPDTEDIKYGFEGGRVVKIGNTYHMITSEMVGDPYCVRMRTGYWTSENGTDWRRRATIRESDADFTGASQRAAIWGPMMVYHKKDKRWHLFYVCYKALPQQPDVNNLNFDGVIQHAVSDVKGIEGIGGPYTDREILMRYDENPDPWEGHQGVDSFFPYRIGKQWYALYGSATTQQYNRTDGHRDNMEFEQYGGYTKLGYDFNDSWKLWGDVNITQFKASNPGEAGNPYIDNDSRITRGMTSLALENHYEKSSGALSFFYNWGRHKINDGYHPGGTPQESHFNSKDRMLGVSWYQSATLFAGNRLTTGFDYQHFGGESWNRMVSTGERVPGVDKQMDEFAGYVDFRQDLGEWLSLDAGIRVDHHSHIGTEWIPQGGLSFHLPRQTEVKAMVSKGFRNPTIREMYMFPPQNPDLMAESLMSYELSFSQRVLDGTLSYGINLYYIDGDNMIMTVPTDGKPKNVNTGKIENRGIEANIGYRITPH